MDYEAWTDQWRAAIRDHVERAAEFVALCQEQGFSREEAMVLLVSYIEAAWTDRGEE